MKSDRIGVKEIAAILGCCEQTVRRYHARGFLPTEQIGGRCGSITCSRAQLQKHLRSKARRKRQ